MVYHLLASPAVWLTTFGVVVVSLVPDMSVTALRKSRKYFAQYISWLQPRGQMSSPAPPPPSSDRSSMRVSHRPAFELEETANFSEESSPSARTSQFSDEGGGTGGGRDSPAYVNRGFVTVDESVRL